MYTIDVLFLVEVIFFCFLMIIWGRKVNDLARFPPFYIFVTTKIYLISLKIIYLIPRLKNLKIVSSPLKQSILGGGKLIFIQEKLFFCILVKPRRRIRSGVKLPRRRKMKNKKRMLGTRFKQMEAYLTRTRIHIRSLFIYIIYTLLSDCLFACL